MPKRVDNSSPRPRRANGPGKSKYEHWGDLLAFLRHDLRLRAGRALPHGQHGKPEVGLGPQKRHVIVGDIAAMLQVVGFRAAQLSLRHSGPVNCPRDRFR